MQTWNRIFMFGISALEKVNGTCDFCGCYDERKMFSQQSFRLKHESWSECAWWHKNERKIELLAWGRGRVVDGRVVIRLLFITNVPPHATTRIRWLYHFLYFLFQRIFLWIVNRGFKNLAPLCSNEVQAVVHLNFLIEMLARWTSILDSSFQRGHVLIVVQWPVKDQ